MSNPKASYEMKLKKGNSRLQYASPTSRLLLITCMDTKSETQSIPTVLAQ